MAIISNWTYKQILGYADMLLQQVGMEHPYDALRLVFNLACKQVSDDIGQPLLINSISYPSGSSLTITAQSVGKIKALYADSTRMTKITYSEWNRIFGTNGIGKASNDDNVYYAIVGNTLYYEETSSYTNLIFEYETYSESYEDSTDDTNTSPLLIGYGNLIGIKIASLIDAKNYSHFKMMYETEKRDAMTRLNEDRHTDIIYMFDDFNIDDETRNG